MKTLESVVTMEKQEIRAVPIMVSLMIGVFIGLFNQTALNMALTNIMSDYQISASAAQWLTTGYLLVLGILVPISGILNQWIPTRNLFTLSLGFSIVGTLLASFSLNFTFLMIARVIQAIGAGILMPLMMNIILVLFPASKRGSVMGLMMLVIMLAPATGPTLSGLLIDSLGWHGIFWVSLPLLAFSVVFGLIFMQNVSTITKPKVDIFSIFLSTIGFGGIVFGFSSAGTGSGSWGQPIVIISMILGVIALVVFSFRQFKLEKPMLDLHVFRFPMFSLGTILVFICMLVNLSVSILMPMYLKGSLLLSAFTAGLLLLPGGILNGLTALFFGRVFDKYGPKYLVTSGFFIAICSFFAFSRITTSTAETTILMIHSCTLIGVALIMNPAQTNGLNQLPRQLYPDGSAVMGTIIQVGGAIGVALAITNMSTGQEKFLLASAQPTNPAVLSEALTAGVQHAFMFALGGAIIGFIISLFIKRVEV